MIIFRNEQSHLKDEHLEVLWPKNKMHFSNFFKFNSTSKSNLETSKAMHV